MKMAVAWKMMALKRIQISKPTHVCRTINDGTPMIQCSSCTEWYHMACCAVPSRFMTNKRLQWKCRSCAK